MEWRETSVLFYWEGEEKSNSTPTERVSGMDELTVFLEKGEAGSSSAVQCWNPGFKL